VRRLNTARARPATRGETAADAAARLAALDAAARELIAAAQG
jgi:hypothetical protein